MELEPTEEEEHLVVGLEKEKSDEPKDEAKEKGVKKTLRENTKEATKEDDKSHPSLNSMTSTV